MVVIREFDTVPVTTAEIDQTATGWEWTFHDVRDPEKHAVASEGEALAAISAYHLANHKDKHLQLVNRGRLTVIEGPEAKSTLG